MTDNIDQLPQNIVLDLDTIERPKEEVKPEFAVNVKGRRIVMEDPANLDWRDLLLLTDPTEFLRHALTAEDRKFLFEQDIEGWRFNRLMEAYYTHFDLDEKVRQAQRQQRLHSV